MVKAAIPVLLPISRNLARLPNPIGVILRRLIPVANYEGVYPLSESQLYEWALLDTFDWLSPVYDNPQTRATVHKWAEQAALCDVQVLRAGHLVVRGLKEVTIQAKYQLA